MSNKKINYTETHKNKIQKYCALQERCITDVKKKMNKWNIQDTVKNNLIELLITQGYLNEDRFAKSFCRGKFKINKWGKIKIINALKQKGVAANSIKEGIKEIKESEYLDMLDKLFTQKKTSLFNQKTIHKKKKIVSFLIQKGFESSIVWEKVNEL